VIANFQGANKLQGFFLQEEDVDADGDPMTSEGVFIFCNTCPTPVAEGQRVCVTGTVSEINGMTESQPARRARSSSPVRETITPKWHPR